MTNPKLVNHRNPLWQYLDARGVEHVGHVHTTVDLGGTDVTYFFHDCETGELSLVSGSRLKNAERIWVACPVQG